MAVPCDYGADVCELERCYEDDKKNLCAIKDELASSH